MKVIKFIPIILCVTIYAFSQNESTTIIDSIFDKIINSNWKIAIASSTLIEKGKPVGLYSPNNVMDGKIETSWVEGIGGSGLNEYICIPLIIKGSRYDQKPAKLTLSIINGYAKNKKLFDSNNRLKTINVEIYEAPITGMANADPITAAKTPLVFFRMNKAELNDKFSLQLKDSFEPQTFYYTFKSKHISSVKENVYSCVAKIIIKDIYKGALCDDTCVSEINFKGYSNY